MPIGLSALLYSTGGNPSLRNMLGTPFEAAALVTGPKFAMNGGFFMNAPAFLLFG